MGFLNHATNNIIVDAVLTEKGRELLSNNDGSFNITSFSFADDEVDYEILKHYGLIIGKEKIEKNTPIFEAITDTDMAVKYENLSLTNNTTEIFAFPKIQLQDSSSTFRISSNSASTTDPTSAVVNLKTFVNQDTGFTLSTDLRDEQFIVRVFDELLEVSGSTTEVEENRNSIAEYTLNTSASSENVAEVEFVNQRFLTFTITALNKVTSSTYQFFASVSNPTEIKTQIEVEGVSSGATFIIPVTITSN